MQWPMWPLMQWPTAPDHSSVHVQMHEQMHVHGGWSHGYSFYRPLTTARCPPHYGLLPTGPPTARRLPRKSHGTRLPAPVHARPPRHPYGFVRVESLCTRNRRTASLSSFNVRLQRPVFNVRPMIRSAAGVAVPRRHALPRVPARTHQ
ncbi:hypothetical protein GFH48_18800 [Streptomyces fagopyri]|uniref:Uncharacterized protein n=1 Tax=Streptomyces fagopyri TaxID=2662397 RepID=A0A5Q0LDX3_9ACTN|nr:hypothetical protein GFH48_18800 [Streptomyces fagopyri]